MADISKYLEKRGDALVALQPIRVVLAKTDFETNLATEVDDTIHTYGVFNIESLDGKDKFDVKFPLIISLNVIERESTNGNIYLIYQPNEILISRMGYFKGPKQAIAFLDLLIAGKFDTLSPEELVAAFNDNMKLNGASSGIQSEIVEAMVSELIRWSKDQSVPFRLKTGKVPDTERVFLTIKETARSSSVFSALAFEDVKKAVQSAVLMTRTKQKQRYSPIEKSL